VWPTQQIGFSTLRILTCCSCARAWRFVQSHEIYTRKSRPAIKRLTTSIETRFSSKLASLGQRSCAVTEAWNMPRSEQLLHGSCTSHLRNIMTDSHCQLVWKTERRTCCLRVHCVERANHYRYAACRHYDYAEQRMKIFVSRFAAGGDDPSQLSSSLRVASASPIEAILHRQEKFTRVS
jgi:hypothetical protein